MITPPLGGKELGGPTLLGEPATFACVISRKFNTDSSWWNEEDRIYDDYLQPTTGNSEGLFSMVDYIYPIK